MSGPQRHRLIIAPTARRQLTESLPEAVANAAYGFVVGPLLDNPYRVGKQLRPPWLTAIAPDAEPTASSTASTLSM